MLRRAAAILAALVVFATSVAIVAPGASAADCSGPCVVVTWTVNGSNPQTNVFTPADLSPLVGQSPATYRFCDQACPPGRQTNTDTVQCGVPIRTLVSNLGPYLGPDAVSGVDVPLPNAVSKLRRSTHDLASNTLGVGDKGGPFPFIDTNVDGSKLYPVVFATGGSCDTATSVGYVRPLRDPQDTIYNEYYFTTGEIDINVNFTGTVLKPTIESSRRSVKTGESVTFNATLPGGAASGTTYTWYVNDTAYSGDAQFVHTFQGGNGSSYRVYVVAALTSADASGQSRDTTISIGKRAKGAAPGPGGGNGGKKAPVVGPNDAGGLHAGERPNARSNGPVGPSGGSGRNAAGPARGTSRSAAANPSRATSSHSASPQNDRGFIAVNGILLNPAAATLAPTSAPQRRPAQPEAAAAARAGAPETKSYVFGLSLGAAVLVLLLLGVFGESRRPGGSGRRRSHS